MRTLVELKRASIGFTDVYVLHLFSKARFEQDIAKRADSNTKSMVMAAADVSNRNARQHLSELDDEIVWGYMTHLGVDIDYNDYPDEP